MNSSDKKSMFLVVFVTIFIGLLMIFFFKPDYSAYETGAAISGKSVAEIFHEDFDELIEPLEIYDSDVSFINKKT